MCDNWMINYLVVCNYDLPCTNKSTGYRLLVARSFHSRILKQEGDEIVVHMEDRIKN